MELNLNSSESKSQKINLNEEEIYKFDDDNLQKLLEEKPWDADETYFKKVVISTLASMKIVDHAIRGGDREICGYMTGYIKEGVYFVLDAVEIPIIGTQSRVEIAGQMGDIAHEYTFKMLDIMKQVGREHQYIGWYHSHPGFNCFLSNVDVNTQKMLQAIFKTFFALVVDPYKTLANRKVELACFRCYKNERPKNSLATPLKNEEYGPVANKYYKLEHSFFSSKFEEKIIKLIYKNYWIDTLTTNFILCDKDNYNNLVSTFPDKIKELQLNQYSKNEDNEVYQKKLDYIKNINTQVELNFENEKIKELTFNLKN